MSKGGERVQGKPGSPIPYGYGRSLLVIPRFAHQDATLTPTGIPADLAAAVNLVVTTVGDIITAIQLNVAVSLVVTTTADLLTAIRLNAAANVVITTAADLTAQIRLAAQALVSVTTQGVLTTAIRLAAAARVVITSLANLSGGTAVALGNFIPTFRRRRR